MANHDVRVYLAGRIALETPDRIIDEKDFVGRQGRSSFAYLIGPAHDVTLRAIHVRALECRARVYLWNHEDALAVEAAREVIELEPFRETAHQLLMRAHGASGNVAEALHAYERCRKLIAEELGADPSPETKALHLALLQGNLPTTFSASSQLT